MIDDVFRSCLYLGCASQIRWHCASFTARGLAELRRKTENINWKDIILYQPPPHQQHPPPNIRLRVDSSKSKLYHTAAIRERVLSGIYGSLGCTNDVDDHYDATNHHDDDVNNNMDKILLDVHVWKDQVHIYVNAFPEPLHRRGYRLQTAKAPLREDLAYAMLLAAGWIPSWFHRDDNCSHQSLSQSTRWMGLMDPFCGSGTIAIEGAAMSLGLPPGRLRGNSGGPFRGTMLQDSSKWASMITQIQNQREHQHRHRQQKQEVHISASDRDTGAMEATRENAKRAGVLEHIMIQESSLSGQFWFENPLKAPVSILVVTNPPFGKRVSAKSSSTSRTTAKRLLPLYQTLGQNMKRLVQEHGRTVLGVILTDNPGLVSRIGSPFAFRPIFNTMHGGIEVSAVRLDMIMDNKGSID
jgi:23S rRNA G2445 N2-methylase RlmL